MKTFVAATAAIALFATPVFAIEPDTNANATGGKPSSSMSPATNSAAKNEKAYDATSTPSSEGAGPGTSGASSAPTAPQEKQDLHKSGEAPSEHNDPGTATSPPSPDTK